MKLQAQRRNPQMMALLGADFQHLKDPPRLFYVTYNLGGVAPTDAGLDTNIATPANVPGNCMFLVIDSSDTTKAYLTFADPTNGQWFYITPTLAV